MINDGELILGDGHESFEAWQTRINGQLEPGTRIIGNFSRWDSGFRHSSFGNYHQDGGNSRLSPPTADYPKNLALYQLEGKRDDGYFFYYDRGEIWDPNQGYRPSQKRASCVVEPTDRFILAYDAATLDELIYYLHSRTNRHDYVTMIPLLKTAIRLKRAEAAQEEPFRQLLVGQIMLRYGVDADVAAAEIPSLVEWYKFKAKNHRPLVGDDDAKALRMIVDEFAIRLRERENRKEREAKGEFAKIEATVLGKYPNALLIAHKSGADYVALVPSNDDQVFVAEITLTIRRVVEHKEWRTVDTRYQRWHVFYQSERWATWQINASLSDYLTDPEIQNLGHMAQQQAIRSYQRYQQRNQREPDVFVILATTFDRDTNEFHVYARRQDAVITDMLLTGSLRRVTVSCHSIAWRRAVTRDAVLDEQSPSENIEWPQQGLPWGPNQYRRSSRSSRTLRQRAEVVMFEDHAAIDHVHAEMARFTDAQQQKKQLERQVGYAKQALAKQWETREEQRRFQAFLQEYGDVALWEGHRKTLKPLHFPYGNSYLDVVLNHVIEQGIDLKGMTFAEAIQWFHDNTAEEDRPRWRHDKDGLMVLQLDDLLLSTVPSAGNA